MCLIIYIKAIHAEVEFAHSAKTSRFKTNTERGPSFSVIKSQGNWKSRHRVEVV